MVLGVGYFNLVKDYYRRDFYKVETSEDTSVADFFKMD
jgi:hypothetical protein